MTIPATMKAYQINGKNEGFINEIPVPELFDENSIIIKNEAAIICNMTDSHIFEGSHEPNGPSGWDMPLPCTLGHESAGIVVKKGASVTDVEIGDRVALAGFFASGSFAEYTVANDQYLKLPDNVSAVDGALLEMMSCTYQMVETIFTIGDSVVVMGCGGAGSYVVKQVIAGGASQVIVVEPHADKRTYALAQGADYVIDPTTEDVVAKVKEYTNGEMVDDVFEMSGYPESQSLMCSLPKRRGKIGMFGVNPDPAAATINLYDLHMNWSAIYSAGYNRGYTRHALVKALDLVANEVVDLGDMITHGITLEGITDAIHMIHEGKENIRKIVIKF